MARPRDERVSMVCTFAIRLCAAVDECDTVLEELLGALDGGLGEVAVFHCGCEGEGDEGQGDEER